MHWNFFYLTGSTCACKCAYPWINCYPVNPMAPKSDQHIIFPYNITPESHI